MKKILVVGAGRSSIYLIDYLLRNAAAEQWQITIADISIDNAIQKIGGHPDGIPIALDCNNSNERKAAIENADIVVSMLPAFMHFEIAKDCVTFGKHLATASYVTKDLVSLHQDAKNKGLVFLNEIGLDPGIDHMSAMQIIDTIRSEGGKIVSFKSYCGGLIAPECNDNPWGYKFTWNPRNVILAGNNGAQFLKDGKLINLAYEEVFSSIEKLDVNGLGEFDAYPNRNSLDYKEIYGLADVSTMIRGTLRSVGFCEAWKNIIQLGLTNDNFQIEILPEMTMKQMVACAFNNFKNKNESRSLQAYINDTVNQTVYEKLDWLGIFSDDALSKYVSRTGNFKLSTAVLLQEILEKKWELKSLDKDMVVMHHSIDYLIGNELYKVNSSLIVKGEDQLHTAMAKTVGLPLGIGVKVMARGNFQQAGIVIPVNAEVYNPILKELAENQIVFNEFTSKIEVKW